MSVFKKGNILRYYRSDCPIIVMEVLNYEDNLLTFKPLLTNRNYTFDVGETYQFEYEPERLWQLDTEYMSKRQFDKELEQLLEE